MSIALEVNKINALRETTGCKLRHFQGVTTNTYLFQPTSLIRVDSI